MDEPLWSWDALVAASGGAADGAPAAPITGFSIDSREIASGDMSKTRLRHDMFVALKDQRDGHEFVTAAFGKGAAAALVATDYARKAGDGALIRVADTLQGLEAIARASRARLGDDARVIAVTGSAGKTGTKEMLRACLSRIGPTHAPEKSFNNHWGVPLTLARMPAATRFAVIEIGMNHAGEITPLTKLARPHVAIITNVLPVHLGHFASEDGIADAKAEILLGLEPGGVALINRDNPHYERLSRACKAAGRREMSFGRHAEADVRLLQAELGVQGSMVTAEISEPAAEQSPVAGLALDLAFTNELDYTVGAPGEHYVMNSLAVAGALYAAGVDIGKALAALQDFRAPTGRGQVHELSQGVTLVDDSYNANPASMRAAFETLALYPRGRRRVAILGDMLELGTRAVELHVGLKGAIDGRADVVHACGPNMRHMIEALPPATRGEWRAAAAELEPVVVAAVAPGDIVMIKGSNGSRTWAIATALKKRFASS